MIGDGQMQGTVLNDGVNQARATIELAVNAAKGNDVTEGTDWTATFSKTKCLKLTNSPLFYVSFVCFMCMA